MKERAKIILNGMCVDVANNITPSEALQIAADHCSTHVKIMMLADALLLESIVREHAARGVELTEKELSGLASIGFVARTKTVSKY